MSEPGRSRRKWLAYFGVGVRAWPVWLQVALVGYGLLGVFGVTAWVVAAVWSDLSATGVVAVAGVMVAPAVVGLLWPRLTGFKAFGVEVSLAGVTVGVETSLAAAITAPDLGSAAPHLVAQMRTLLRPEVELVEIDLRDGAYWWSTRLYLLAALAHDLSEIRAFVFVAGGIERTFLGVAPPAHVRRALAIETPELERTYLEVAQQAEVDDLGQRVEQIVYSWAGRSFGADNVPEEEFADRVSPNSLHAVLAATGRRLTADSVEWPGYSSPHLVRALVRDFDSEYVALVRRGGLDRIVNLRALSTRLARKTS